MWSSLDKDEDGFVTIDEHVQVVRNKELGGKIWDDIDSDV
jgi:hypothetical protein